MRHLQIGLLGAARIAPHGIVQPVQAEQRATLVAVAARDPERAAAFAREHGIARVHKDYAALIDDPEIDLVYIATPPAFHAEWALRALDAGKHVLVEKPFSLTTAEAQRVFDRAGHRQRHVFEAMHAIHHPLFRRTRELVRSGVIGQVRHVASSFDVTITNQADFRWQGAMGGGALMDLGVYPLAFVRALLGDAFVVDRAHAALRTDTDTAFSARLRYRDGAIAMISASMTAPFKSNLVIEGERGRIVATNPVVPHRGNKLVVEAPDVVIDEEVIGPTSWTAQLHAICDTLIDGVPFALPANDFVRSMAAIEQIRTAGEWPALRENTI
jgi:predicted dehydrogenase